VTYVPRRLFPAIALAALVSTPADAQEMRFFYPAPSATAVSASKDVTYRDGSTPLQMDVYRPAAGAGAHPAIIFFNVATGAQRGNVFYRSWAEIAASKGIVAIVPDLRRDSLSRDFESLLAHVGSRASNYGIDGNAIAVYAGSGNVYAAFPLLENPDRTDVRAAVMYYGTANVPKFRRDLPVLFVRAGLDRPDLNASIDRLAGVGIAQNAPVTLLNHPFGYHAFEIRNDDAGTRDVIDQTIAFVKQALSPAYQAALHTGLPEATAAGHVLSGNAKEAAAIYARLVASRPENPTLHLAYGEALLADSQFVAACGEFDKLRGKGLGPRDLGLPAARACAQKGDADAAIGWLQSIPARFRPNVERDPAFASLRERADFRALFQR
jgi:dienelactone hydrolase